MTTPYKPISFSPGELLTRAKMNQITANQQWIFENFPRTKYDAFGVKRTSAMKIACGAVLLGSTKYGMRFKTVYFGTFFSTGCRPIIMTNVLSRYGARRLYANLDGFGSAIHPDHRGFNIALNPDPRGNGKYRVWKSVWVHWMAIGF